MSKQTKIPFSSSSIQTKGVFELVHIDTRGPYNTATYSGAYSFLTLVDDFSIRVWTYLMITKSQTISILNQFTKLVQTQFNTCIKAIRTNNGAEFLIIACQRLLTDFGNCLSKIMCLYSPTKWSSGRKHKHLLQVARSLLFQFGLPKDFWSEAILHATFIINILPTKHLSWKTPFELLFQKPPRYELLKVFGCLCYVTNTQP